MDCCKHFSSLFISVLILWYIALLLSTPINGDISLLLEPEGSISDEVMEQKSSEDDKLSFVVLVSCCGLFLLRVKVSSNFLFGENILLSAWESLLLEVLNLEVLGLKRGANGGFAAAEAFVLYIKSLCDDACSSCSLRRSFISSSNLF